LLANLQPDRVATKYFAETARKAEIYQEAKEKMVRDTGFEPVTPTVSMWCSTTELTAHSSFLLSFFLRVLASANCGDRFQISNFKLSVK
jgi:hypothetical protein